MFIRMMIVRLTLTMDILGHQREGRVWSIILAPPGFVVTLFWKQPSQMESLPHMNRELLSRENGIPNAGNIRVSNVRTFPAQVYGAIQRITYVAKYATLIAYCGETMGRSTTVLLRLGISYLVSTSAQEDERGLKQFPNDTCLRSG